MAYFTIMAELRGCYADNESAFVIKANTRRELKAALVSEARDLRDAGGIGLSKRKLATFAAFVWSKRKAGGIYPFVLPWRYAHQSGDAMGLFAYVSSRADYLASQTDDYAG
jgi:hypothetical protein